MGTMFDYLKWRGDIEFSQIPMNPVDALILSTLSYVWFDNIITEKRNVRITLRDAAKAFLQLNGIDEMVRVKDDIELLKAAALTERFGKMELAFFRNIYDPDKEIQFAALTCFLDDDTAVVVFRGTDQTLAGWKEDFNMAFCDEIPSQIEALRYVTEFAESTGMSFYITGHSKGGNLAVYAAAKASDDIKERIIQIYNHDGPGFTEHLMGDPGYLAIVPKIRTYIPQSSVVGMLLQHEEEYTIVKSRHYSLMQHNPYYWEIMGPGFVLMEEVTDSSVKIDKALKKWMEELTIEERSNLIDTVYGFLTEDGASNVKDLLRPKYVGKYITKLRKNEKQRSYMTGELVDLLRTLKETTQDERKEPL